ncbi:substrate-binding periplasmic protein [Desulfobacterota bacterium M19]
MFRVMIFLPLLTLFLFYPLTGAAASRPRLRVLTCEEPPANYMEHGRITGISTDIVRELMRRTRSRGVVQLWPWPRAYNTALHEANVVLFTAGHTARRDKLFYWVGPLFKKRWIFLARRKSGYRFSDWHLAREVKSIVVMRDDARSQLLHEVGFRNVIEVGSHLQALRMLAAGRASLWPTSDMEAAFIARQGGIPWSCFSRAAVIKDIYPAIIISKGTALKVVHDWQRAWEAMSGDGSLNAIARHWSQKLNIDIHLQGRMLVFGARQGAVE